MRTRPFSFTALLFLLLAILYACNPQVDVLAPAKKVLSVYGVLNPDSSLQYIRVSSIFQTNEDSYSYAAENDLILTNLQVRLSGAGTTYLAEVTTDQPKDPGFFRQDQFVYRIHTPPGQRLQAGERFDLEIREWAVPIVWRNSVATESGPFYCD